MGVEMDWDEVAISRDTAGGGAGSSNRRDRRHSNVIARDRKGTTSKVVNGATDRSGDREGKTLNHRGTEVAEVLII